jgi:uncharacterized Fe-S center protein
MSTNNKPSVYFASSKVKELRKEATLPPKFKRMLDGLDLPGMFKGKTVAIKMHVGGEMGYTTVHPLFVRLLVQAIKDAGGDPFITDGSGAMHHAKARGYTEEVLGAPLIAAAGIANNYAYTRPVNYRTLESLDICGNIVDADAMVVLSHGKGHGNSGFGAAIKNIAMGCVARDSRGKLHKLQGQEFSWDSDRCNRCRMCVENCPATGAIWFDDKDNLKWFEHHCKYCRHCVTSCPQEAVNIDTQGIEYFQRGMAIATRETLATFEANRVLFINVMMNITPFCDCWGFSTPSLVPDIGIVASKDIVAVEQASLDLVKSEDFIQGSLPESMKLGEGSHLFEKIHGKDPYLQVRCAEEFGLGSSDYELVTLE